MTEPKSAAPHSRRGALPHFAFGTFGVVALAALATVIVVVAMIVFALKRESDYVIKPPELQKGKQEERPAKPPGPNPKASGSTP